MKGLRQNIIDFEIIATGNSKTLVFIDSSDYIVDSPERPLLEVTLPGYNKYFLVNIVARQVNTLNSNTIGLTDLLNNDCLVDLPDGVYKLKYKICPYTSNYKTKLVFRTTLLEDKLKVLYDQIDGSDCSKKTDREISQVLTEVNMLIAGAQAVVEKNEKKANDFYRLANTLIDNLTKCCN